MTRAQTRVVLSERRRSRRSASDARTTPAASIASDLETWFAHNARPLPWRDKPAGKRDGYASLVLEALAQQTQVSRVAERWPRFLTRFPTVHALAAADESEVLAEWSGLGYYRRARSLHAAARAIVSEHGGVVPRDVAALLALPGVGRYTAGAIASMAYGERAPIVDGNVARVLLRVHGKDAAANDPAVQPWLWERAGDLAKASAHPGVLNEALMELGATVCVPQPGRPKCEACPLAAVCSAGRAGRQMEIPRTKTPVQRQVLNCGVALLRDSHGRVLLERRPDQGMWAGMWQAITVERADRTPRKHEVASAAGVDSDALGEPRSFAHGTTHRDVRFRVYEGRSPRGFKPARGEWVPSDAIGALPLANAQRRALGLARA